jgi:hypothetical protein
MMQIQRALKFSVLFFTLLAVLPAVAVAQRPEESEAERLGRLARRGAGFRAGAWFVEIDVDHVASRSPAFEGYFQRGLDRRVALESSVGVWWVTTITEQTLPIGGTQTVETESYVIPLLSSLKFFPFTDVSDDIEPYLLGGIGFALGLEREAENAIGSSGTSIVTGIGFRGGAGIELHLTTTVGFAAGVKYQWIRLSEEMIGKESFSGLGLEGGITYRFQF